MEGSEAEAEVWPTAVQKLHRTLLRGQHVHLKGSAMIENMRRWLLTRQGGSEKEIYAPEEGADTGLFASVLQVFVLTHFLTSELIVVM